MPFSFDSLLLVMDSTIFNVFAVFNALFLFFCLVMKDIALHGGYVLPTKVHKTLRILFPFAALFFVITLVIKVFTILFL